MNTESEIKFSEELFKDIDYSMFQINEEIRENIKNHPEKYINCDPRIRMGLFYTTEEKERYIEESLARPLPGIPVVTKKRNRIISLFNKDSKHQFK